jgi:sugar phosphate isomerase/epimerase
MGETVEETDEAIGARVAHVHVKDAIASGDGWRFTTLGEGALPVPELLTMLARRGYDGVVSVDYEKLWHPELDEPEHSLPQHAAVLRREIAAAGPRAEVPTP